MTPFMSLAIKVGFPVSPYLALLLEVLEDRHWPLNGKKIVTANEKVHVILFAFAVSLGFGLLFVRVSEYLRPAFAIITNV